MDGFALDTDVSIAFPAVDGLSAVLEPELERLIDAHFATFGNAELVVQFGDILKYYWCINVQLCARIKWGQSLAHPGSISLEQAVIGLCGPAGTASMIYQLAGEFFEAAAKLHVSRMVAQEAALGAAAAAQAQLDADAQYRLRLQRTAAEALHRRLDRLSKDSDAARSAAAAEIMRLFLKPAAEKIFRETVDIDGQGCIRCAWPGCTHANYYYWHFESQDDHHSLLYHIAAVHYHNKELFTRKRKPAAASPAPSDREEAPSVLLLPATPSPAPPALQQSTMDSFFSKRARPDVAASVAGSAAASGGPSTGQCF